MKSLSGFVDVTQSEVAPFEDCERVERFRNDEILPQAEEQCRKPRGHDASEEGAEIAVTAVKVDFIPPIFLPCCRAERGVKLRDRASECTNGE